MQDDTLTKEHHFDLTEAKRYDWLHAIDDMGEERGYFENLGEDHSAILTDAGPTLIVTFETIDTIRKGESHKPMGWSMVDGSGVDGSGADGSGADGSGADGSGGDGSEGEDTGWSNLCIMAHKDTWFRDKAVYAYFDRLVDDGFFDEFDHVVFYGAGMCGYAAAAFSVAAPGATVIAVGAQATLNPARAGWDHRYPKLRRTNFTDRYGYGPDMVEGADAVYLLFDPAVSEDHMHASLFTGDNIHHIPCRRMGKWVSAELWSMGVLPGLITKAANGELTPTGAFQALRARRKHLPYLRGILDRTEVTGHPQRVAALSRYVTRHWSAPRFRRALEQANKVLEDA